MASRKRDGSPRKAVAAAGLTAGELQRLPGSEARKVAIARIIWEQTTVNLQWIAEHLHLRSAANASQQIRRHRLQPTELPKTLKKWTIRSSNAA